MLNPKLAKYADRLRELIAEGTPIAASFTTSPYTMTRSVRDESGAKAWAIKSHNILELVFGATDHHSKQFDAEVGSAYESDHVNMGVACLRAALNDLEGGFLHSQEVAVASEVFDSVLEQAKHLNENSYKDPAAVLMRVVLEDSLKRLARNNSIGDMQKATKINDDLKAINAYNQIQWRRIQVLLDLGNKAAHGNFSEYTQEDVRRGLEEIEQFLAVYFT